MSSDELVPSLGPRALRVLTGCRHRESCGSQVMRRVGLPARVVFPTLWRLERIGLVEGRLESQFVAATEGRPRRNRYRLTTAGRSSTSGPMVGVTINSTGPSFGA